uniref:Retrovirus-related Pol polyprotein from transposon TNT 1-94-like beta-barrel domain-containing protein n=1 Tax=Oryza punctata TaxID=4537 RepID=A0A0E0MI58_ORYPU
MTKTISHLTLHSRLLERERVSQLVRAQVNVLFSSSPIRPSMITPIAIWILRIYDSITTSLWKKKKEQICQLNLSRRFKIQLRQTGFCGRSIELIGVLVMDRTASVLKNIKGGLLDLKAILAIVFVLQWISLWMFWLLRPTNGIVLAMLLASLVLLRGIRRGIREARYVHARHVENQHLTNINEQYMRPSRALPDNQDLALLPPIFPFDIGHPSSLYFQDVNGQSVPGTYVREARDVRARHAEHQRLTSIDEQYMRHYRRAFLDNQDSPSLVPPTFYFDNAYPSTIYFQGVNDQSVPPTYVREDRNVHARHAEHQHLTNIDEQYRRCWRDDLHDNQDHPYFVPPTFCFDNPSSFYFQDVCGRSVPPAFVRAITWMLRQVLDDIMEGIVVVWMNFSKVSEFKIMGACLLCLLTFAVNGGDGVQLAAVLNRPVMKWMLRFYAGRVVAVVLVLICWMKNKKRSRASSRPFELSPKVYVFCTGSSSSSSFGGGGSNSTLSFILDSGASYHATGCRDIFLDDFQDEALDEIGNTIGAANGYAMSIRGRGSISLPGITLPSVLYVPELRVNVVSASQLTLMDYYVRIDRNGCLVREVCTEAVVGRGRLTYNMLYQMETLAVPLDRRRCTFCELIGGQLFLT